MKKIIHHLRSQPIEKRRQMLNTLMLLFAFILFVSWTIRFGIIASEPATGPRLREMAPVDSFKQDFSKGYEEASNFEW